MTSDTFGLPKNVYDAFVRKARSMLVDNYVGGGVRLNSLEEVTQRKNSFGFMVVYSTYVSSDTAKGRYQLRKMVKQGLLIEHHQSYRGQMIRFSIADKIHEYELLKMAYRHYKSLGYIEGEIMDKVH